MFLLFVVDTVANPLLNFGRNKEMHRAIRSLFSCFQHVEQQQLLYLPTQIRFLIGGERVTCHRSKLETTS